MYVVVEETRQIGHLENVMFDETQVDENLREYAHEIVHEIAECQKDQVEDALAVDHLFAREYEYAEEIADEADVVEFHLKAVTHDELGNGRDVGEDFFVVGATPKVIYRRIVGAHRVVGAHHHYGVR